MTNEPTPIGSTLGRPERVHYIFLFLVALLATGLFFAMVRGFVVGLFLAAVFAGLLHPLNKRVERALGGRPTLATVLTLLGTILVVVLPLFLFLGIVASEAARTSQDLVAFVDRVVEDPGSFGSRLQAYPIFERLAPYEETIRIKLGALASNAANFLVSSLAAGTAGTARFLLHAFVVLYAMFFFLRRGEAVMTRIGGFIPMSSSEKQRMLGTLTSVTRATLKGTLVIGIVQGGLAGGALALAGIEGAAFWTAIMVVLSVIPGIGTMLVWFPVVVYLFLEGQQGTAIALFLWCALVVGTVDNVLRPVLVGKDTELPDLLVLLGTLGGLVMFGATGIVVGPVIAAIFLTAWQLYGEALVEYAAGLRAKDSAELVKSSGPPAD